MLEAKIPQAALLKKIVEAVKELVKDVNLDCDDSGISMQAMDESNIALTSLMLEKKGFDFYRCDRNLSLGVKLTSLSKILKCAGNDDRVIIKAEDDADSLNITFESPGNDKVSEFDLKLMNIDTEALNIPDFAADCTLKMLSSEFSKLCRDLLTLGATVSVDATKDGVRFSASGEDGNGCVLVRQSSSVDEETKKALCSSIELENNSAVSLSLKYLNSFTKASPLAEDLTIRLKSDAPVLLEYKIADIGYIRFYLAPQINDDE